MYRCGHDNSDPEPHGHQYLHHKVLHHDNWRTGCSYCRHRVHNANDDESNSFRWFRAPGTFVCNVLNRGTSDEDVYPTSSENQPEVSRRGSKSIIRKVSSTKRLGRHSRSHSESRMTVKIRRPTASMGTTKHADSVADVVTMTDPICGFACGSALRNLCATPPPPYADSGTSIHPEKTVTTRDPPTPSPSLPCQSLFSNALRRTPLFVKHESIQTTPSQSKTRSAFVVIGKEGDSATATTSRSRSPVKDTDPKPPTEPHKAADANLPFLSHQPLKEDANRHHHHHYHGNVCWYHHIEESCGHTRAHAFYHHKPCTQHHFKSEDDGDSTWAGLFINVSKGDRGGLLKFLEAWTRITNTIRKSRSAILLERNLSPKTGAASASASSSATLRDSRESADAVPVPDPVPVPVPGHDQQSRDDAGYCYGHAATSNACFYNHNYYQHLEAATEDNFFYPEKEAHVHSHFQEGPEEFYDCFECQICSSHQF